MHYAEATSLLKHINLRPGWRLHWWEHETQPNTITIEILGTVKDSSDYPTYTKLVTAHGTFDAPLDTMNPFMLIAWVFAHYVFMAIHEEREFFKVDSFAPFHPHRLDGRLMWAKFVEPAILNAVTGGKVPLL